MPDMWITEVLDDMCDFAIANNMPLLAEQLEDAKLTALVEQANRAKGPKFVDDLQPLAL